MEEINYNNLIDIMQNELKCIETNVQGCDKDCGKCSLVKEDTELITAYTAVIKILNDILNRD